MTVAAVAHRNNAQVIADAAALVGTAALGDFDVRCGLDRGYVSRQDRHATIRAGISEAVRVLRPGGVSSGRTATGSATGTNKAGAAPIGRPAPWTPGGDRMPDPNVRDLLVAKVDEITGCMTELVAEVQAVTEQLHPERARSCRNAITMCAVMVDEIRLRPCPPIGWARGVSADRVEALERRVVAREQMLEAMLIIEDARRRARERANGTHLRAVPDEAQLQDERRGGVMHDWGTCGACGASDVDVWGDEPHTYCAACCDDAVYGPTASTSPPPLRNDRLIGAALLTLEREGKVARTDELKESVRDGGPRRVWQSL